MAFIRRTTSSPNTSAKNVSAKSVLELAEERGIPTNPLDIHGLINSLGIELQSSVLGNDVSGYLCEKDGTWIIAVNALHHPKRQRFTLAHELGHYMLHRAMKHKFIDEALFRSGQVDEMEIQANTFAAELLMPEAAFRAYVRDHSKKIEDIANHFKVSALAARVRAKALGYSGHGLD